MGEILVGTCSWTDRALVSSGWYPPGLRDAEGRLRHYAAQFPVVEVDATYYSLPSARNSTLWAERTPDGFRFDVKAFSLLTSHPTTPNALPAELRAALPGRRGGRPRPADIDPALLDEVWQRFSGALEPLKRSGRLGTLLFQFPPWFTAGDAQSKAFLAQCAQRTAGWPVAVEFRHPAWWQEDERAKTEATLKDWDMSAVAVDMTQKLPTSIPPVTPVTSPRLAVARFHGRNDAWGTGTKEERFRHAYAPEELREWIPRLHEMAEQADEVHTLFNNCCADAAARAAESMRHLLGAPAGTRLPHGRRQGLV
ncbi:DUF72 domain-containing protein [Streptomyces rhizosphaericus]|uniref:DUF72 domain-containing protein n=1 Tax=Streptomyces rhizosphaericus TaxID=114699 RepID=A0A6G4AH91_9ACTN|nr:DUF72 domain-containing protein [Streptomyces rhizosphaericus]NEW72011.1 DUF72 domain-containing protein [Streptomyces rhizosphaericus]